MKYCLIYSEKKNEEKEHENVVCYSIDCGSKGLNWEILTPYHPCPKI